MGEIVPRHRIALFLGYCTGTSTIVNKQCVNKWNVGIRFEGDKDRDLKIFINKKVFLRPE